VADKEGPLSGLEGCSVDRKTKKPDKRFRLTILDAAAILVSAGAIFLSSLGAVAAAGKPEAIISDGSKNEWVYPLDVDRHVEVTGPLGITVVHIHSGEVCIESSPCPNKTCVAAGDISKPGQWVACLPNQVFVRIEGGPEHGDEIDAHSW
jgi:hypothetical protein